MARKCFLPPPLFLWFTVAALTACGQSTDDKQATFFMGRVRYSSSDGNDCGGVGQGLMQLVSRASTIYRSFYKIDRIRCLHEPRDVQLEGVFYEGNLVAVVCEDGLCCAFSASNTCNPGKGVSPEDSQKLALNIAVYALTH